MSWKLMFWYSPALPSSFSFIFTLSSSCLKYFCFRTSSTLTTGLLFSPFKLELLFTRGVFLSTKLLILAGRWSPFWFPLLKKNLSAVLLNPWGCCLILAPLKQFSYFWASLRMRFCLSLEVSRLWDFTLFCLDCAFGLSFPFWLILRVLSCPIFSPLISFWEGNSLLDGDTFSLF